VHVRFRGGGTRSVSAATPVASVEELADAHGDGPAQVDRPARTATEAEIATILNERGFRSGQGHRFHSKDRLEHFA